MKLYYLLIACLSFPTLLLSQSNDLVSASNNISFLGYSGLVYTPSAYTAKWGALHTSYTHYDKNAAFTFEAGESNERSFVTNIGFLPFAEFSIRLTKPYNSSDKNYGIGDRSITGRIQILKERKYRPAILIGTNDFAAVSSFFNATYFVASKSAIIKGIHLNGNLGYGFKFNDARRDYLQGVFGGAQMSYKTINLMAEYDAERWNIGLGYQYKQFLFLKTALIDLQYVSFNIGLQFQLH